MVSPENYFAVILLFKLQLKRKIQHSKTNIFKQDRQANSNMNKINMNKMNNASSPTFQH